jgi:hypothetical protein
MAPISGEQYPCSRYPGRPSQPVFLGRPAWATAILVASRGLKRGDCTNNKGNTFIQTIVVEGLNNGGCAGCRWAENFNDCTVAVPKPGYVPRQRRSRSDAPTANRQARPTTGPALQRRRPRHDSKTTNDRESRPTTGPPVQRRRRRRDFDTANEQCQRLAA